MVSGFGALCLNRFVKLSNYIGALGAIAACLIGVGQVFFIFRNASFITVSVPWPFAYASFSLSVDSLSALFLLLIFILSGLAAVYGLGYLRHYYGKKNIGTSWFFFNLLVVSMALVVMARNAVLFLIVWEWMSISSFFLVLFEGEKKETVSAGLIYLIASQIGTFFLLLMFLLLGNILGTFDFIPGKIPAAGFLPSIIFVFAVIGFGTKAGFMPLHIWLPQAHPAAPSHVSAIMSGVMIKIGIYGLIRILTFLDVAYAWWGYLLIIIGIVSGILGILFALAQHDLKRLLAYSSIENMGIITIGLGLAVLGMYARNPILIILGFTGSLLHVINHAFFKGLLFFSAGSVLYALGTKEMNGLGGLFKKLPVTGFCFFIAAAAICGLPGLNGFSSEFLIYFAAFKSLAGPNTTVAAALLIIASLALIGGLAVVGFTKALGIVFLGTARNQGYEKVHQPGRLMLVPMIMLALGCIILGLFAPFIVTMFSRIIFDISAEPLTIIQAVIFQVVTPLIFTALAILFFLITAGVISFTRRVLLKGKKVDSVLTWDCGYSKVSWRMQYTASSYVQPIVDFFKGILRTEEHHPKLSAYFPEAASFKTQTDDMFQRTVFQPMLIFIQRLTEKFKWFQHGRLQIYILYIFIALIALFIWKL
jgi:formate hydrogenlyase subunit 3/multisubunit Na+/H+ antiporter MnhD subunit